MSKTILLTGGTGFLGSHLGYEFIKRGDHVIYHARGQRGRTPVERVEILLKEIDPDYKKLDGSYEVYEGDITQSGLGLDPDIIKKWIGHIDELWHCAAVLHFRDTYETITESININGTVNVLELINKLGVKRYHHVSTAYVSGKADEKVYESQTKHDYDFRNPYERTKYDAEQEVRKRSEEYGLETTIYRPSVIVGDTTTGKTLSFTGFYNIAKMFALIRRLMLRKIKSNPELTKKAGIYLDGDDLVLPLKFPCNMESTVNLVPIDYVVNTILLLADTPESIGQVYHITNPTPPKVVDLMNQGIAALHLKQTEFVEIPFQDALDLISKEVDEYAEYDINISFCLEIREYLHYFYGEPEFDLSNVYETLKSKFVPPPSVTPAVIEKLFSYANEKQWRSLIP